ncbi:hypothetical protein GYMLUDRAFT_35185 [Collybiopsis luxurians FD-317 M1]|nr:hypothetical protein GYMLUDRAFT_35185 [Collybiopsis luxurians FD-317 M1]
MTLNSQSQPIRLGFVGLSSKGWPATMLAPPLFKAPLISKYTLVAVCTTNLESAKASAAKYSQLISSASGSAVSVKAYHGSAEDIAQDQDVRMVAVAVRPMFQKEAALKAIEAGRDLFIEWPVGTDLSETKEIYEAARKKQVNTIVGCQMRFAGFAMKLKSMMTAGKLGKIYSSNIIVSFNRGWGPIIFDFFKHSSSAANGATLLDAAGGHIFDLILHILGPVASVSAEVMNHHPTATVIDSSTGKLTGETVSQDGPTQVCVNGRLHIGSQTTQQAPYIVHLQSGVKDAEFTWVISGENGTVRVQADSKLGFFDPSPEMYWNGEKVALAELDKIALNWEAFADGRKGSYATVEDAMKTKEILHAAVKSAKEGRRVDLLLSPRD